MSAGTALPTGASGPSFEVADAVVLDGANSFGGNFVGIFLADRANLCALAAANPNGDLGNAHMLQLLLEAKWPPPPGTYAIPVAGGSGGAGTSITLATTDNACKETDFDGKSGQVVITSSTTSEVVGTYDVQFDQGGGLSGSFRAAFCAYMPSQTSGPSTCLN
jgi:hypothetical protein